MEALGLAFAIFPLAVKGVKSYADGIQTIKDFRDYQTVLKEFSRELNTERIKFEHTCFSLLENSDHPAVDSALDYSGRNWAQEILSGPEYLQREAFKHLYQVNGTMEAWQDTARALKEALEDLHARFPTINSKKARKRYKPLRAFPITMLARYREDRITSIRRMNSDLSTLANGGVPLRFGGIASRAKVSVFQLDEHNRYVARDAESAFSVLKEKMEQPECNISHLANLQLTMRWDQSMTWRSRSQLRPEPNIEGLEIIFYTKQCVLPEWRRLHLERYRAVFPCKRAQSPTDDEELREEVAFGTAEFYPNSPLPSAETPSRRFMPRLTQFLHIGSSTGRSRLASSENPQNIKAELVAPSGVKRVRFEEPTTAEEADIMEVYEMEMPELESFCKILTSSRNSEPHPNTECLGLLIGSNGNKHAVWNGKPHPCPLPSRLISLAELLDHANLREPTPQDRLLIGVKLVLAVMQLGTTEWLPATWGAEDIWFPEVDETQPDANDACVRKRYLGMPLVKKRFGPSATADDASVNVNDSNNNNLGRCKSEAESLRREIIGCNQSLYSLGIVLIELWHWQRLEAIYSRGAGNNQADQYMMARALAGQLLQEAGKEYCNAVRHCIYGLAGVSSATMSLEERDFRREVCDKVVLPLLENLKRFCGVSSVTELEDQ